MWKYYYKTTKCLLKERKKNKLGLKYNNLWIVYVIVLLFIQTLGLPRWLSDKESTCQCRRCRFDSWIGKIPWRRKYEPTPVFLPGKSHGQRSLVGYSPWGQKESDTTEQLKHNIVDPAILTCKIIKASHFSYFAYFALAESHTQPIHLKCVLNPCVSHSSECSQRSGIHVSSQMRKLSWISENVPALIFLLKSPWLPALSKLTGLRAAFVRHWEQSCIEMIIIQKGLSWPQSTERLLWGCVEISAGTSLVVQGLRNCLPMKGMRVWSLVKDQDPTCHETTKPACPS